MSDVEYLGAEGTIVFIVPIRTTTGLNAREHWAQRAKRVKKERSSAYLQMVNQFFRNPVLPPLPLRITLTRIGPRKCDSDAVPGGLKGCRDGIADALGIDDGNDEHATWEYRQERGKWAVRVEIKGAA